jgi:hypothetical protein
VLHCAHVIAMASECNRSNAASHRAMVFYHLLCVRWIETAVQSSKKKFSLRGMVSGCNTIQSLKKMDV